MNKKILNHFKNNDPVLYSYCIKIGPLKTIEKENPLKYFHRLCKEIICQQLSGASGRAIFGRFLKLFPDKTVNPQHVLSVNHDDLRNVGMSHAKANYVANLAHAVVNEELDFISFDSMTDEKIIEQLTKVKGVGRWTAEMFLMFVLCRPDVFSHGDLGLRKAIKKIYGFENEPTTKQIEKIVSQWSPFKTYASRLLWASLEL
jgi:DNA-3-methyladenine glycosylase II